MMPITMAGSVAVLLNVFFRDIPTNLGWDGFVETMSPLIEINGYVNFGTIAILALFFAFALGYNIAKSYEVDRLGGGLVTLASFVATLPQTLEITSDLTGLDSTVVNDMTEMGMNVVQDGESLSLVTSQWGAIDVAYIGATGLFTALIIGLLSSMIYSYLMNREIIISLPEGVPPAVMRAFASIIPGTVAIYASGLVGYLAVAISGQSLSDLISTYIQIPLLGLSQGLGSVIIITFLIQLLWFFGMHGHNVLAPIMEGVYLPALTENTAVYEATQDISQLPWTWTRGSFDAYAQMGGSGATIALIIAIFIFSKREDHKTIAKLSAPMGVFNINEPVIFGMPIVLNPSFLIPWLIIPPITATIAYILTAVGFIPPVYITVPWITPPGLYAYLATGGSIRAALVSLLNIGIAFAIYAPFVISANKISPDTSNDMSSEES
jgi:PTS system cellobiose-specific IIC component